MSLRNWFASKRKGKSRLKSDPTNDKVTEKDLEAFWTQCYNCQERLYKKEVLENLMVCIHCGYHFRISAEQRIEYLTDRFEELAPDLIPGDPLEFSDTEPYKKRIKDAEAKSKTNEAVTVGIATVKDVKFALAVMDFTYLGGSMGSVVGEKITRLIEKAIDERLSLVIVSSSGGARMQEGTFSLMQMVKTGSALGRLHEAGLLFLSVLTEPTFGGVTASYGTLGDLIIAEEGARIGFAGRRVIEQTIRQKLPADFQTADYLLKYGQVDMVLKRKEMKQTLYRLIQVHEKSIEMAGPYAVRQPKVS